MQVLDLKRGMTFETYRKASTRNDLLLIIDLFNIEVCTSKMIRVQGFKNAKNINFVFDYNLKINNLMNL